MVTIKYYEQAFDSASFRPENMKWSNINLLPVATRNTVPESWSFLENKGELYQKFEASLEFLQWNIPEAIGLHHLSFLPLEIQSVIGRAVHLAMSCFYKEGFSNLRSGLELALFLATRVGETERNDDHSQELEKVKTDIAWLKSESSIPYRKRLLKSLRSVTVFLQLTEATSFERDLEDLHRDLDDLVHTNGFSKSNLSIHRQMSDILAPPTFSGRSLESFVALHNRVIEVIAVLFVGMSPRLVDEVFAYQVEVQTQEPLIGSGLWGHSSENFFRVISDQYQSFFRPYWRRNPG